MKHIITHDLALFVTGTPSRTLSCKMHDDPARFEHIKEMAKAENWEGVMNELDPDLRIGARTGGEVSVVDNKLITANGDILPDAFRRKMNEMISVGASIKPFIELWQRLKNNPEPWVIQQLCHHIVKNNVFILDDGRFVLYKSVNSNWTSHYDRKTLNIVGTTTSVPRSECDLNPRVGCAAGLHTAPWQYVENTYGRKQDQRIIELFCSPEHIISVPDADAQILRQTEYYVNREIGWHGTPMLGVSQGVVEVPLPQNETGRLERTPEVSPIKAKRGNKAPVAKAMEAVIRYKTDRITIPGDIMVAAGFRPHTAAVVVLTDARSRFLFVTHPNHIKATIGTRSPKFVTKPMCLTSTGALGVRNNVLAQAQIQSDGADTYTVKIAANLLIEIRRNK